MEESILSDKDREKKIDYVLVTELFSSLEDDGKDFDKELNQKRKKREIFLENLREKGLEIQTILIENSIETFDLVYVPEEVIKKYATILKMKMPLKPELCKAVQLSDDIHRQDKNATEVMELEQAQAKKSSWGRRLMPKRMKPKLEDMDEVFYAPGCHFSKISLSRAKKVCDKIWPKLQLKVLFMAKFALNKSC